MPFFSLTTLSKLYRNTVNGSNDHSANSKVVKSLSTELFYPPAGVTVLCSLGAGMQPFWAAECKGRQVGRKISIWSKQVALSRAK